MPRPLDGDKWPFSFLWGVAPQPPGHDNSFLTLDKALEISIISNIEYRKYERKTGSSAMPILVNPSSFIINYKQTWTTNERL
jgi:hypothetical protein